MVYHAGAKIGVVNHALHSVIKSARFAASTRPPQNAHASVRHFGNAGHRNHRIVLFDLDAVGTETLTEFAILRALEATIESDGTVKLAEQISLSGPSRALVTILDPVEGQANRMAIDRDAVLLAESALTEAWSGEEEDKAWEGLRDLPDLGKDQAHLPAM